MNTTVATTEKSGKTSKGDVTELRAIHKENALNGRREIEAVDVSTGANLDSQQRQVNQMKESEALQASAGGGTTTVVSKGGDSNNVTNTTINSGAHIDRTMDLVPAF